MKILFKLILLFFVVNSACSQTFLNGSFENNTAGVDQINLSNPAFNSMMANTFAFGSYGDMDIITSGTYCGLAQSGAWYTALTGGATDAITMQLSTPLVSGTSYTITFWDKGCLGFSSSSPPVQLGVTNTIGTIGTPVFVGPIPTNGTWVQRTATFTAPANGLYLSVVLTTGSTGDWTQIDNFAFSSVNPVANFVASDSTICPNTCINFTDLTSGGPTSWSWTFAGATPATSSVQNPTNICYATPGTYAVTLTASNLNGSSTATHNIIVNPNPTITISGNSAVCLGQSTSLTGNGGTSYTWSNGSLTNPITVSPTSTTVYSVTGTDANGCSATSSQSILVNPLPTPSVVTTDASCGLNNGSATANPGGLTYNWSNSQTTQVINSLPTGTYTVTVTDGNSCSATSSGLVNNTPGGTVTMTSTPEGCDHSNGTATATLVGGTLPATYLWSNAQTTQTAINLAASTYYVTVTDANGCSGTASIIITNIPGPTATISNVINDVCNQFIGAATVDPLGGNPPYSFVWSNGTTNQTLNNVSDGTYSVTVTDATGCTVINTADITDVPAPIASFFVNPVTMVLGEGPCLITDNSINTTQWIWNFGDGTDYNGEVNSHIYSSTGSFTIMLIVTNGIGCSDTSYQTVIVNDIYTMYLPNTFTPDGDGLNDVFGPTGINFDINEFQMYIYNRWGEEMYRTKDLSKPWNGTKNNSSSAEVTGVYVYRILFNETNGKEHEYFGRVTLLK